MEAAELSEAPRGERIQQYACSAAVQSADSPCSEVARTLCWKDGVAQRTDARSCRRRRHRRASGAPVGVPEQLIPRMQPDVPNSRDMHRHADRVGSFAG